MAPTTDKEGSFSTQYCHQQLPVQDSVWSICDENKEVQILRWFEMLMMIWSYVIDSSVSLTDSLQKDLCSVGLGVSSSVVL